MANANDWKPQATFIPGGDDYAMPEVVSPAPQRYEDFLT